VAESSVRVQDQYGEGRRLHTAGCGTGRAADQHQNDAQELSGICESGVISCIKSCGPRCHRLKERREDPLFDRQAAIFNKEKQDGGNKDQDQSGRQDQLGLKPELVHPALVLPDVLPGPEAESSDHDQRHDRQVHQNVAGITGQ